MGAVSDYFLGKIEFENQVGWSRLWKLEEDYYKKDFECKTMEEKIAKLKEELRRLKDGRKIKRVLGKRDLSKGRLRK